MLKTPKCYNSTNIAQRSALVRCLEREIAFSVLNNLLFRTNYFLFRTNFIESAFLERCFIARLHCFRLGNHNRFHTEKQHVFVSIDLYILNILNYKTHVGLATSDSYILCLPQFWSLW